MHFNIIFLMAPLGFILLDFLMPDTQMPPNRAAHSSGPTAFALAW